MYPVRYVANIKIIALICFPPRSHAATAPSLPVPQTNGLGAARVYNHTPGQSFLPTHHLPLKVSLFKIRVEQGHVFSLPLFSKRFWAAEHVPRSVPEIRTRRTRCSPSLVQNLTSLCVMTQGAPLCFRRCQKSFDKWHEGPH